MSFGGSAQAMITILKNNANMRNKRKRFSKSIGGYNKSKQKAEYNLPKASAKQLREIRNQMEDERKTWWLNAIVLLVIGTIMLFGCVYFVINTIL